MRYQVHVYAYVLILANPWPSPNGREGYPVDMELDPPERQNRLTVIFRWILAIPAYVFMTVLTVVLYVIGFLGWFAALALGRMPERHARSRHRLCLPLPDADVRVPAAPHAAVSVTRGQHAAADDPFDGS